ncbi:MAG: chalcone isomerase family protein, partial [Enterobacterales bacterium]|nr:chalcone isomerase family protein [Enterobacterales bacterium]
FKLVIISLASLMTMSMTAREVAGVDLEEVARLSVANTELVLNGAAVRKEAQHAVYVGGLYLKNQISSLDEILADPNPKRFLFYCSTSKISSDKLIKAWLQGFHINYSDDELAELEPLIEEFNKVWSKGLTEGDEVWVDYIPQVGTRISLNGEQISEIPSKQFYNAFLKTWLGPHPFNARLKSGLLGK